MVPSAVGVVADRVGVQHTYVILTICFVIVVTVGLLTRGAASPARK
jgi:fucose permease